MLGYVNHRLLFGKKSSTFFDLKSSETLIKENWLKKLQCSAENKFVISDQHGTETLPYACDFCTVTGMENICLVVDEEGFVSFIDTSCKVSSNSDKTNTVRDRWQCHKNAVFDVAWCFNSNQFVTASGDTTAVLWDANRPQVQLQSFIGHSCSLKSISILKDNPNLIVSGSRDGNALIWDCRHGSTQQPVLRIQDAHAIHDALTPQRKRRRKMDSSNQLLLDSRQTVSSVVFQDPTTVITAGAMDGTIKLWDIRKTVQLKRGKTGKSCLYPKECIQYGGVSTRRRGYTCLTLDTTNTRLFASCTDNTIYEYDLIQFVSSASRQPVKKYTGHHSSSFFVRIHLSPDDNFLLSGCDDEMAFIWKVSGHETKEVQPRFCLKSAGMEQVTAVSWCPNDWSKVVTCSDDCAFRVWNVPFSTSKTQVVEGYCESVAVQKSNKETTMSPKSKDSPNPKVTIINSPSVTASPNGENSSGRSAEKRKPALSMKQWLVKREPHSQTIKSKAAKKLEEKYLPDPEEKENTAVALQESKLTEETRKAFVSLSNNALKAKSPLKLNCDFNCNATTKPKPHNWLSEICKNKLSSKNQNLGENLPSPTKHTFSPPKQRVVNIEVPPRKRHKSIQSYFSTMH